MSPTPGTPRVVLAYGLLGLIPFLAPPLIGGLFPDHAAFAARALALYGGLILSFLGGARWAMAVRQDRVDARIVSLAMIPTLVALAVLLLPAELRAALAPRDDEPENAALPPALPPAPAAARTPSP